MDGEGVDAKLASLCADHPMIRELGARFADAGAELFLVGGAVRDRMLGRDVDVDLDFATSATPERTEELLGGWAGVIWLTGAAFGTVSAERHGVQIEITTYRSDVYTTGSRHPEVAWGESLEQDLSRRDFTVNALAMDASTGELVDRFDGAADLERRVLRTPVAPEQSFGDDPLRMLRLARFASTLGFTPEDATRAAATEMADQLEHISAERIRVELEKLLVGTHPADGFRVLVETGLIGHLPGFGALAADSAESADRIRRIRRRVSVAPLLRTAAGAQDPAIVAWTLLAVDDPTSNDDAAVQERLRALTCSNATIRAVATTAQIVRGVLSELTLEEPWNPGRVRKLTHDAGEREADVLAVLAVLEAAGETAELHLGVHEDLRRYLADAGELDDLSPPLDGGAVMRLLGIPPGPQIGEAIAHLTDMRLQRGAMSVSEAEDAVTVWWLDRRRAAAG